MDRPALQTPSTAPSGRSSWISYFPFLGSLALTLATIIFSLVTAVLVLFMNLLQDGKVDRSHWIKTQGVCIGHDVQTLRVDASVGYGASPPDLYLPVLLYRYTPPNATAAVEGRDRLDLGEEFSSAEAAKASVEKSHKVGSTVTLYYNPDLPTESSLNAPIAPGSQSPFLSIAIGVSSILALGSLLCSVLWRRWWKTRELAEGSGMAVVVVVMSINFGLPMFVGGLSLMGAGVYTSWQAASAKRWELTEGKILSHDIQTTTHENDSTYAPRIRYTYWADGPRESDSIFVGAMSISYNKMSEAEALLNEFPEGSKVKVYYDPNAPTRSALIRRTAGGEWTAVIMGGIIAPFGMFLLMFAFSTARHGIKVVQKTL